MKYKKTPCFRGYRSALVAGVLFAAGMVGLSTDAEAASIRVSQESSAGAGDFDANVLGTISTFSTGMTSSAFYKYNTPNGASYNGEANGGPPPISDTTINFFVITSDGLTFYNVHDQPSGVGGGSARMSWSLSGGDTAAFMVGDDGNEGLVPVIGVQATSFTTFHRWLGCCTDGFGLGTIDGSGWALYGEFDTNDFLFGGDIDFWTVLSADGGTISLSLDLDRRVRFDIEPDTDGDGVNDDADLCPATVIPEGAASEGLNPNHWALTAAGNGFDFDTVLKGKGKGPNRSYTIEDTAGCSCEQIIEIQGLGDGHSKHGCSIGAMDNWVDVVNMP